MSKKVTRGSASVVSNTHWWGSTDPNQKGPPSKEWIREIEEKLGWRKRGRKHR